MKTHIALACLLAFGLSARSFAETPDKDQADFALGQTQWQQFKDSQAKVCDPQLDSYEVLTGAKTEYVALVLHGFTLFPRSMDAYVQLFASQGLNVIAPRLARHYTLGNLTDLDNVSSSEWVAEVERAYQVATHLGKKVVVVGYSLGGLLAGDLALKHPGIEALFVLAPVWRMNPTVSLAALAGAGGISLNSLEGGKMPVACGKPYYSGVAGEQIEKLASDTEVFNGGNYRGVSTSAYWKLNMPIFMGVAGDDNAVNTDELRQILVLSPARIRGYVYFSTGGHGVWVDPKALDLTPKVGYVQGLTLKNQILQFWAATTAPLTN